LHARCFEKGWSAADFRRLSLEPHCCGFTARLGSAIAGFVLAQFAGGEAEILTIAVGPDHRRAGIAAGLLDRLAEELAQRGAEVLFLEVSTENRPARALYQAAGFTEAGRRRGYYQTRHGSQDALILRRPLIAPGPNSSPPSRPLF
jgi:ribosomal-protein-alanine N-acetyltransferase